MWALERRWWTVSLALGVGVLVHLWARESGQLDLSVYRAGAQRLLDSLSVYDHPYGDLPFTYTPFAALTFVPLALLTTSLAEIVVPLLSCGALVLVWRRLDLPPALVLLVPLSVALEPVWATLHFGQVNLVLMALVLLDLSRSGGRTHGVWAGVAAGIKLTPLFFAAFLVVTGQWRTLGRFLVAFTATVAFPLVVAPGDVRRFWTEVLPDSERIGAPWFAVNQSVMGALARFGGDAGWVTPTWFLTASLLALSCLAVARLLWQRGDRVGSVSAAALGALLASPVSWSHHWVWAIPLAWTLAR